MASVLVVDDHPDLGPVLARLLQRAGHDVEFVCDGQTALDYARTQRPALMILDIMMPGMTGFDVLQKLSDAPLTQCPACGAPVTRVISAPSVASGGAHLLKESHTAKHGFTQYRKIGKGQYEKTSGKGPRYISGD